MVRLYEFLINNVSTGLIKNTNDDFVDLGLSVLWAKCNIGSEKETDYGHYYQWGGLEPMDDKECNWENYPFNNGRKHFDEENFKSIKRKLYPNGTLSKKFDIAYQTYKGKVHIPTTKNYQELIFGTKSTWIINYNNSSINGRLFTAENDNSIFIPAAGVRQVSNIGNQTTTNNIGGYCSIWSSTINKNTLYAAWGLDFNCNMVSAYSYSNTCAGHSVRAVKEK